MSHFEFSFLEEGRSIGWKGKLVKLFSNCRIEQERGSEAGKSFLICLKIPLESLILPTYPLNPVLPCFKFAVLLHVFNVINVYSDTPVFFWRIRAQTNQVFIQSHENKNALWTVGRIFQINRNMANMCVCLCQLHISKI